KARECKSLPGLLLCEESTHGCAQVAESYPQMWMGLWITCGVNAPFGGLLPPVTRSCRIDCNRCTVRLVEMCVRQHCRVDPQKEGEARCLRTWRCWCSPSLSSSSYSSSSSGMVTPGVRARTAPRTTTG